MAELPSATTRVSDTAGPVATGTKYCALFAACSTHADGVPRVYTSTKSLTDMHGYCEGAEYAAMHFAETGLPVIFVPCPIVTSGVVGRINTAGNTGSSVVSIAAGGNGTLIATNIVVTVKTGGTVGTDQILLDLSLDGGRTSKRVRLGTASSYAIPYIGATLSFGAGTLVTGDTILTAHTSAPKWDSTGLTNGLAGLAAQLRQCRSFVVVGDLTAKADADAVAAIANAYETTHNRFVYARTNVRNRLPVATLSNVANYMTGNPSLTFASSGHTITRGAGSWITDGFVVGDTITVTGSASNNTSTVVTGVTETVLTFASGMVNEGPVSNVTVKATPTLTFAEVGGTGDTCTRNRGSFLDDGFRAGDTITIANTSSNNTSGAIASVTATVITMGSTDLNPEVISTATATITTGESKASFVSTMSSTFAAVDAQPRLDIALGHCFKTAPIIGYQVDIPASWVVSLREYQHDLHVATFEKAIGPLEGVDLNDTNGNLSHFDERIDGGALAARFTCLRTWSNGPAGAYVALSLTRATDDTLLSRTQNVAVVDLAQVVCQLQTENAVGKSLVLDAAGHATQAALNQIKRKVNAALGLELLQNKQGEGPRVSSVNWEPATDDVLNVAGATLHGTLSVGIRGTIEHIQTTVKVG